VNNGTVHPWLGNRYSTVHVPVPAPLPIADRLLYLVTAVHTSGGAFRGPTYLYVATFIYISAPNYLSLANRSVNTSTVSIILKFT
jgi:hypothetical protein